MKTAASNANSYMQKNIKETADLKDAPSIDPSSDPRPPPPPITCGDPPIPIGECVPGEAPYKYDAACGKVKACGQCGCAPAQFKCTSLMCSDERVGGTGFCYYDSPPGICGDVPDRILD